MTKIDIFSGFLGAGKTTLIKKLLKEALSGEKVVLIENEFGEIGIDGGFLKDAGIEITEMNSGCICCSLVGDFGEALKKVLDEYAPDRILIEPSGVGKLSDVIKAVAGVAKDRADVTTGAFVTVVDVQKCKMYMKNFGEFFNNQIEYASTIVLSRTQKVDDEKLGEVLSMIKAHNEKARIITTPWEELTGDKVLATMEQVKTLAEEMMEESVCHVCGHHHHEHDEHEHHHCHHDHDDHHHKEHEHSHHDEGECHHKNHHDHEHEHHHEHGEECCCHHDHHHHHADEVFTSWGVETPKKYDKEKLEDILDALSNSDDYGMVLRAKGMVCGTDGGWLYFDMTPGEVEIRNGAPEYTGRLCVIGSGIKEEALAKLFEV